MKVDEEDLHKLGEALEARTSVLDTLVIYDRELEGKDYASTIESVYQECLTDYSIGKRILEGEERENSGLEASNGDDSLILTEDETSWMRLDYKRLGDKLTEALETHEERIDNSDSRTGRERLEDALVNYEVKAWSIPPSYDLSLEHVDRPPKERDQSEIIGEGQIIE